MQDFVHQPYYRPPTVLLSIRRAMSISIALLGFRDSGMRDEGVYIRVTVRALALTIRIGFWGHYTIIRYQGSGD